MTTANVQIAANKRNAANMKLEFVHDCLDGKSWTLFNS